MFHTKTRFFTLINSLHLLPHSLRSFGSFKTENPTNPSSRLSQYNPSMNIHLRINKYTKKSKKKNYDYDFKSSNANPYEL
jgi:hypothetical protein